MDVCRRHEERIAQSGNGFSLYVDVGEGCETFEVMLGRFGNGKIWRGLRFTKTQYAEHFVSCHLAVIKMLDLCKEAGILKSVEDEGHYYETRSLEVLAENINYHTGMLKAISKALTAPAGKKGMVLVSNVERSANYVVVQKKKH